ncbi:MAG: alcohol dehydrogenase [Pseudomonadota bacterium]
MKSYDVVEAGAPLEETIRITPQPTGSEVLLRVLAAGVCHTDLHLWDGYFNLGHGKRLSLADRGIRLPHTLGHENVGEVMAIGPEVTDVSIGDRRILYPWIGCRACRDCRSGDEQLCTAPRFAGVFKPGGFSDHLLVPHSRYLFDLAALRPEQAAPLACSGLTAYSALKKIEPALQDNPVVIIGAGGLGLMCLALLTVMKSRGAIVIETDSAKRAAALDLGAIAAVDGADEAGLQKILELTDGGAAAAIDFVGSPQTMQTGLDLLRKGGSLIVVGMYGGELPLAIPSLVLRSLAIRGSYVGSLQEMRELVGLVRQSGLPPFPVTTRPLSEINQALNDLRAGKVIGRSVMQPYPQCGKADA